MDTVEDVCATFGCMPSGKFISEERLAALDTADLGARVKILEEIAKQNGYKLGTIAINYSNREILVWAESKAD